MYCAFKHPDKTRQHNIRTYPGNRSEGSPGVEAIIVGTSSFIHQPAAKDDRMIFGARD